jgi:hypothetical protein
MIHHVWSFTFLIVDHESEGTDIGITPTVQSGSAVDFPVVQPPQFEVFRVRSPMTPLSAPPQTPTALSFYTAYTKSSHPLPPHQSTPNKPHTFPQRHIAFHVQTPEAVYTLQGVLGRGLCCGDARGGVRSAACGAGAGGLREPFWECRGCGFGA